MRTFHTLIFFLSCTLCASSCISATYTVTFDIESHGSLAAGALVQEVGEGYSAIEPAIDVDDGWAFAGWDKPYNDITESVTVTAEYIPRERSGVLENLKFLPDSTQSSSEFGYSVSISGDTAVIGSALGDGQKAYVYTRIDGKWAQQAVLTGDDDVDLFGGAVGISGDTIVISSLSYDHGRNVFYVYVREDGVWREQAQLVNGVGSRHDYSGGAVAISGDTIVVGMANDGNGSAFVYERMNGQWEEQAKLAASGGAPTGNFGYCVDISGDTIVVTAVLVSGNTSSSGDAYVFHRAAGSWSQQARLEPIDGFSHDRYGRSVSVSGDLIVVGAYLDSTTARYAGCAHVYRRVDGVWHDDSKLRASDGDSYDHFGYSVGISGDQIVVGARIDEPQGRSSGSAYVFRLIDGAWVETIKLIPTSGDEDDEFGASVGLSGDLVLVGAWRDDDIAYYGGSTYFYDIGVPSVFVAFDIDGKANRSGGGMLDQLVPVGFSAQAPDLEVFPGWGFDEWDTDFSSVSEDITVTAYFYDMTSNDSDTMWDGWEIKYLGGTDVSNGSIDSDGDGYLDEDEFTSGSDPLDRSDYFHVNEVAVSRFNGQVTLRFPSNDDLGSRVYKILYTDDLHSTWTEHPMGTFRPDAGNLTERTFDMPIDADAYFFKVEALIEEQSDIIN